MDFDWFQRNATAVYAAAVATFAVGLQVQRWFETGARLAVRVMCPAVQFGGGGEDKREYIAVTVSNCGDTSTSITHFTLYEYPNFWARLRRRQTWAAIVQKQQSHELDLPHYLEPG